MSETEWPCSVDVLVIGGGPAGSSTALALAARGWHVAIADRPHRQAVRIVETLPPASRTTLKDLGVWRQFVAAGHVPASGTVTWWEDDDPIEQDFIVNPHGSEWHVDRPAFDRLLLSAAIEAGAIGLSIDRVQGAVLEGPPPDRRWRVQLDGQRNVRPLSARFLVSATGRAPAFRPAGTPRHVVDRLVGLAAVLGPATRNVDRRPWIEATPSGWWYSAPCIDGRWNAVFFTDADLLVQATRCGLVENWRRGIADAPHTAERVAALGGADAIDAVHAFAANSYITPRCHAERWLAVGDAASAIDPLAGQGLERAMRAGTRAAAAIDSSLAAERRGEPTACDDARAQFQQEQTHLDREYLEQRRECYARVARWRDRPFWRRRSGLPR